MNSQPLDLTVISSSFPDFGSLPLVTRENFLDTIDSIFESGVRAVTLEGPDGIGKTTLAAQYARRHCNATFTLFVRASNRWGYDPEVLRQDLSEQLHWLLNGAEMPAVSRADDVFLRNLLFEFRKRIRRQTTKYRFIVDGLNDIPTAHSAARLSILDLLPLDFERCYFLFTNTGHSPLELPKGLTAKSYPLTAFNLDETKRFLTPLISDPELLSNIHTVCKGFPGNLASVRRSLSAGQKPEDLLANVAQGMAAIFENEWKQVNADDQKQMLLLGLLALDEGLHSLADLQRLLDLKPDELKDLLSGFSFLTVDSQLSVNFTSDAFRKFAATKLVAIKKRVQETVIDDLLSQPQSDLSSRLLPERLRDAGRYQELLDYLSPDRLVQTLERGQSIAPVRRQVDLGVEAAVRLDRDADLMRLCMQKSSLAENYAIDVCRAEIEARMALNDYASALAIANSVALKEDRLQLLAVVAKGKRLQGLTPEPELIDLIHSLYAQINPKSLSDLGGSLASDLIFAAPELAIAIMEATPKPDAQKSESIFATMSVEPGGRLTDQESDSLDSLRAQVTDLRLHRFLSSAALLMGGLSATAVLAEIERIPKPHDKIFFLRQWAVRNRQKADAAIVVEHALKLAIQTTEYTPNARDIRQIAAPLPFIGDMKVVEGLIRSFDAQKGGVEKYGPTVDYVRLQLLLAEAEFKYSYEAARSRIVEVYYYVCEHGLDLSVRAECLAHLLATLARVDLDDRLETDDQIRSVSEFDFKKAIADILASTAEQLRVCSGSIEALATTRVDLAVDVARALNVEPRRDRALVLLTEAAVATTRGAKPLRELPAVLDAIADTRLQEEAIVSILDQLHEDQPIAHVPFVEIVPFVDRIKILRDPFYRSRAYAQAFNLCQSDTTGQWSDRSKSLLADLRSAWESIDPAWERIQAGFTIASDLAKTDAELSREYLKRAEADKIEMMRQSPGGTNSFIASLGIAAAAFTGLLRKRIDTADDLNRFAELIKLVPSVGKQAQVWADIAERFFTSQRADDGREIVTKHVRPLLDQLTGNKGGERIEVLKSVIPSLYKASAVVAKNQLRELPAHARDEAIIEICEIILRKRPQSDPMETPHGYVFDLNYNDIKELIDLLQMMEMDAMMYSVISRITDSLDSKKYKHAFTQQQRNEIAKDLEDLGKANLPNPRFIKHDGYRVVVEMQVARIRRSQSGVWSQIVRDAYAIDNVADRVYVLSLVAVAMPERDRPSFPSILLDVKKMLEQIPVIYDRAEKSARTLAQIIWDRDQELAREMCKSVIVSGADSDSADLAGIQRDVVDCAHRMDPDFATSLVSQLDDDPARIATRSMLKKHVEVLTVKKRMLDPSGESDVKTMLPASCAKAAWMSLGVLNAGRSEALRPEKLRAFLQVAGGLPLVEAYPIMLWAVGNSTTRFADTDQAKRYLRPIFDATILACHISARMTARASGSPSKPFGLGQGLISESSTLLVKSGERAKALDFLRHWLEQSTVSYLKICDPYFGLDDLEVLRMVIAANPALRVRILTSLKHQKMERVPMPLEDSFRDFWRSHLSEQDPPDTEIVVVGAKGTDDLPIHDRWWLTDGGGLRIGTSFRSLGGGKDSEISQLSADEAKINEIDVDRFINRTEREHLGKRLQYILFTL